MQPSVAGTQREVRGNEPAQRGHTRDQAAFAELQVFTIPKELSKFYSFVSFFDFLFH